jgi:hypothetical protein
MDFIVNPLTGRKIKVNGRVYKQMMKQTSKNPKQEGGNPLLMVLPSLADLVIPAGLTVASCTAQKYFKPQKGGGHENESRYNILTNPILQSWLRENHIKEVLPSTMIPIKVLIEVYNQYSNHSLESHDTIHQKMLEMIDPEDLVLYMKQHHLKNLTLQTPIPFAALMGADVFKQLINHT